MTTPLKSMLFAQTLALAVIGSGLTVSADYTLTDDESWTAADVATKMTGVINLNGHTLTVPKLQGTATITDKSNVKYELLEYVGSTTWCGQYIDSGVKGKPGLTVKADFVLSQTTSASRWLVGSREASYSGRFMPIGYNKTETDPTFFIGYGNGGVVSSTKTYEANAFYSVESFIGDTEQTLTVNGEQWVRTTVNPPPTATQSLYIFNLNTAGSAGSSCSANLYGMTILDGDTVLREFVPAKRVSDGMVGLLDLAHFGSAATESEPEFYETKWGTRSTAGYSMLTAGAVTGYVCTDATSGELHVEVAEGETAVNETVALAGGLKLVKEGPGTFVAAKSGQTYAGGTEVAAGTFQVAAADESVNRFVGASGSSITVDADATLDVNGNPDFTSHPLVLAGGTLKNGANTTPASVGAVTLTADSAILAGGGITHMANVALGGKALTVSGFAGDDACYRLAEGVSYTGPGTVSVSGGILSFDGTAARDMRTVDLAIASAVNLSANVTVSNLTSTYTGTAGTEGTSTAKFLVTGTYTASSFHRGCEMQGGSTLDLSALAVPVSNVTFAAGSAITVALGARTLAVGDEVVSWTAESKPSDTVTFGTELEGSYGNKAFEVREDGLYLAEPPVTKAIWKGVNPQNANDPANWDCWDYHGNSIIGFPTNSTVVILPNGCTNSFPIGGAFLAREVVLPATLGADSLDWSGIAAPFTGALDLKGKKLTVSQLTGDGKITDTANLKYELLDSITSTGTQYIDTGVSARPGLTASAIVAFLADATSDWPILGVKETEIFWMMGYRTGNRSINYYKNLFGLSTPGVQVFALGTDYHLEASAAKSKQTVKVNGEVWSTTLLASPATTTKSMYFFTYNNNGNPGTRTKLRLSYLTISDDTTVLRNFVPVRQVSTGKVGLLDLAHPGENEFYANVAASGADFTAGTVTNYIYKADASDTPGELHVNVASGETMNNATVTLAGGLKLVKEGAGTFVAEKTGQTYAGGTEVAAGTFSVLAGDESTKGYVGIRDNVVTVNEGATLSLDATDFTTHPLVLAGGTLENASSTAEVKLGLVTLSDDSAMTAHYGITYGGDVELGGKTLTVGGLDMGRICALSFGAVFRNGAVSATAGNGGWFKFDGTAERDMSTVDLKIARALNISGDITVRDLELLYHGSMAGTGKISVCGTYKAGTYHPDCVMLNGSTLDLGGVTSVWSVKTSVTVSNKATEKTVTFADGATVMVSLGGRRPKCGPIVTWADAAVKPADSVTFVLDPAVNARLVRKPEGLWLQTGLLIRIR